MSNKRIFKNFSPSGSPTILVFQHQTSWRYSDEDPRPQKGGVECNGYEKITIAEVISYCLQKTPGVGDTFHFSAPNFAPTTDRAQNFVNVASPHLCMFTEIGPVRIGCGLPDLSRKEYKK